MLVWMRVVSSANVGYAPSNGLARGVVLLLVCGYSLRFAPLARFAHSLLLDNQVINQAIRSNARRFAPRYASRSLASLASNAR